MNVLEFCLMIFVITEFVVLSLLIKKQMEESFLKENVVLKKLKSETER